MHKYIVFIVIFFSSIVQANGFNFLDNRHNSGPLSTTEAFQPEINLDEKELNIYFNIQPKHYLYKNKISVTVNDKNIDLIKPKGLEKNDPIFGDVIIYENFTTIKSKINDNNKKLNIKLHYQGCSEEFNICYPPEIIEIVKDNIYIKDYIVPLKKEENIKKDFNVFENQTDALAISKYIQSGNVILVAFVFLGIGILMAFTPCVFPMVPIISSIVVKHDKKHPVLVSSLYVLGIALCYVSIGLILNIFDFNIQIALQNIYLLIGTSIAVFILGLTMFGFITIKTPTFIQSLIHEKTESLDKKNNYHSLIAIGYLSALMLSPCAVAPLAGTLLFASQYENVLYSSLLLFLLGIGSGLPLILFSSSLKKILPKAGLWMYEVKHAIGFVMILMSYYLMSKIIPFDSNDILSILFKTISLMTIIIYIMKFIKIDNLSKVLFSIIFSIIIFFNFSNSKIDEVKNIKKDFTILTQLEDLKIEGKTLLYIGADWCVACKQMEHTTLKDEEVIKMLSEFKVYYVDITEMSLKEKEILKKYNLQIAPFYVLYNSKGEELNEINIGYLNKNKFLEILKKIN